MLRLNTTHSHPFTSKQGLTSYFDKIKEKRYYIKPLNNFLVQVMEGNKCFMRWEGNWFRKVHTLLSSSYVLSLAFYSETGSIMEHESKLGKFQCGTLFGSTSYQLCMNSFQLSYKSKLKREPSIRTLMINWRIRIPALWTLYI